MECLRKVISCTLATASWPIHNELRIPRLKHKAYQAASAVLVRPERCVRRGSHGSPRGRLRHPPQLSRPCRRAPTRPVEAFTKRLTWTRLAGAKRSGKVGLSVLKMGSPCPRSSILFWTDFDKALKEASEKLEGQSLFKRVGSDVSRRL